MIKFGLLRVLLLAHGRLPTICNEQQGRPTSTSDSLLVRIRISHINWFGSGRGYDLYGAGSAVQ